MKYLRISENTKLTELSDIVGNRNIDSILHINNLKRTPYIGQEIVKSANQAISSVASEISWQRKSTLLNKLAGDSDLFELAATMSSDAWKVLSSKDTFPNMLKIPESVPLTDSTDVFGNGVGVPIAVYHRAMAQLASSEFNHRIDPSVFNEYSTIRPATLQNPIGGYNADPFQWFKIPWGEVTLYSSLSGTSVDFPVYPEEVSDSIQANYSTMPDLIYQYEPWQIYNSSGPRSNSYTFDFHRDMWTGDHRDGKANELIRFCQANCYPRYNGSAVDSALVTLYIGGKPLITGIMTSVTTDWSGPLGWDHWYLACKLNISITEVSTQALNFDVVRQKPLIG